MAAYRQTICEVSESEHLLRRLRGEKAPVLAMARTAKAQMPLAAEKMIADPHWAGFETMVDLIFARNGWRRVSELGGLQKDIDLKVYEPVIGAKGFVQVKSPADQAVLDQNLERYEFARTASLEVAVNADLDDAAGRNVACPFTDKSCGEKMDYTMWRGVAGLVQPTRRPGATEKLIRILPEGIGIVCLHLKFRQGSSQEFENSIPDYETYVAELAEQGMDMIHPAGAPPFMLLGYKQQEVLIRKWERKYKNSDLHFEPEPRRRDARARHQEIHRCQLFQPAEQDSRRLHDPGRFQGCFHGADRRAFRRREPYRAGNGLFSHQEAVSREQGCGRHLYPGQRLAHGGNRRYPGTGPPGAGGARQYRAGVGNTEAIERQPAAQRLRPALLGTATSAVKRWSDVQRTRFALSEAGGERLVRACIRVARCSAKSFIRKG